MSFPGAAGASGTRRDAPSEPAGAMGPRVLRLLRLLGLAWVLRVLRLPSTGAGPGRPTRESGSGRRGLAGEGEGDKNKMIRSNFGF